VNSLGNRDRDLADYPYDEPQDREISLGTGTILGIFFALVLVCALCFGFGYSIGRKSAATPAAGIPGAGSMQSSTDGDSGSSSTLKPRSGSPFQTGPESKTAAPTTASDQSDLSAQASGSDGQTGSDGQNSRDGQSGQKNPPGESHAAQENSSLTPSAAAVIRQSQQAAIQAAVQKAAQSTIQPAAQPVALHPAAKSSPAAPTPVAALPAVSTSGTAMVQIAAVSHQEDAELLLAALKKRGYPVFVRQEPQDHLLHIQVGPFSTRKDAEIMRQHLLTDGYNAILK
jgi:DedD protein